MKKIIDGKTYNTETAKEIGTAIYYLMGNPKHCVETLYRKRTGEFFLAGEGGSESKYWRFCGDNCWTSGQQITPLSWNAAKEWVKRHMYKDYESIFGEVTEDNSKKVFPVSLSASLLEKTKRLASRKGISASSVIESALEVYLANNEA